MIRQEQRLKGFASINVTLSAAIIALLLVGASWWAITKVEQGIKQEIGYWLITVRDTANRSLRAWTREKRANTTILATSPEIVQMTRELLAHPRNRQALLAAPSQEKLRSFLAPTLRRRDYRGYFLVAPDNVTLSASRDMEIGERSPFAGSQAILDLLKGGQTLITLPVHYEVPLGDENVEPTPTIFTVAPIRNFAGEIIAYLVLRIDPWQEFSAIFNRGRIGMTGETYAFDRQGILLNESRFDGQLQRIGLLEIGKNSLLRIHIRDPGANILAGERSTIPRHRQPLTRMAQSAVRGIDGIDLDGYRNYRGVPVLGAWIGVHDLALGIATEMDIEEAYHPLRIARLILVVLTCFSLLLLLSLVSIYRADQRRQMVNQVKLRRANQQLDAFVYTLCHELRNHLTPIIGYADFLQESCKDRLEEHSLNFLAEISTSGNRMIALMEDLLNLARVGRIERPADPVDTREVLSEVVGSLEGQLQQAGVSVKIGNLPALRIPRTLLAQIFHNLVGNAVRYGCRPGGSIEVGGQRRGSRVRFHVRDHGMGIPLAERSRVFEVFFRGSTGKEVPGTGIGLATVRKIARVFGGRAWMEETPGGGSTFWVEMEDIPTVSGDGDKPGQTSP